METAVRWDETVGGDRYLGFKPKPEVARTVKLDGVTMDAHWNPRGHAVVADMVFEALHGQGVL